VDEHEYTYYMDGDTYVTNRRVNLGWAEYDLADIKWVGVQGQIVGLRVGMFEIPPKFAVLITSYFFLAALVLLLLAFLPADTHNVVRPLGFLAALVTHGLVTHRLNKRGYRRYSLVMSGTFSRHEAMNSTNEQQVKRIAEAINRAMYEQNKSPQKTKQGAHTL
jgi:hypothetical protein